MPVSAVDCVQSALQHTRAQLFTRFRWGQWSRLALVGILAAELHVGGCGFGNLGGGFPHPQKTGHGFPSPSTLFSDLFSRLSSGLSSERSPLDWLPIPPAHISEHLAQFVGLLVLGMFAVMLLSFAFLYVNSVFRFILFDSVLRRECSISDGWRRWHRAGARFFLWQIVFQISVWLFFAVLVGVPLAVTLAAGWGTDLRDHTGRLIVGVIFAAGLLLLFVVTVAVVQVLAKDFLVPIMALEGLDFADGWHRLLAIVRREQGRFAVYLLLKLVLSIAAGILFTIIAIVPALFVVVPGVVAVVAGKAAGLGLSVATISLAIIMGTVLLLLLIYLIAFVCVPATVFFPAYALYFFASRYPTLAVLLNPAPAPLPQQPPVPQSQPPFEAPPLLPSVDPIG
jgi:hypothetical protein